MRHLKKFRGVTAFSSTMAVKLNRLAAMLRTYSPRKIASLMADLFWVCFASAGVAAIYSSRITSYCPVLLHTSGQFSMMPAKTKLYIYIYIDIYILAI